MQINVAYNTNPQLLVEKPSVLALLKSAAFYSKSFIVPMSFLSSIIFLRSIGDLSDRTKSLV